MIVIKLPKDCVPNKIYKVKKKKEKSNYQILKGIIIPQVINIAVLNYLIKDTLEAILWEKNSSYIKINSREM